ncbi:hypothetical protein CCP2SC5_1410005 [Azospirillaceae bacterium]
MFDVKCECSMRSGIEFLIEQGIHLVPVLPAYIQTTSERLWRA